MKKLRVAVSMLLAVLMLASLFSVSAFAKSKTLGTAVDGNVDFNFAISCFNGKEAEVMEDGVGKDTVYYSDSWFAGSAYTYNHELATASLAAGMNSTSYDMSGTGISPTGDLYTVNFLKNIGCESDMIFTHRYEICNTYDDTSAIGIGIKSIPGTDKYLIPVFVRGNGYGGEWASNVRIYDKDYEGYAVGFRKGAEYAAKYLNEYLDGLKQYGIERSELKLWICGFSRGGAIANNLGQIMTDTSGISPENIFVYGFAVPQTVMSDKADTAKYKNIFSICSEIDLVPRVPLVEWGFTHYGTTLYTPCMSKSTADYNKYLPKMQEQFRAIMSKNGFDDTVNEPVKYQEKAIDLLISYLTDAISSPKEYGKEGWQDIIIGIVKGWKKYDNETDDIASVAINAFIPDAKVASATLDFLKNYSERSEAENYAAAAKLLTKISLCKTLSATKRDAEVMGMLYDMVYSLYNCIRADIVSNGQSKSTRYYLALADVVAGIINDGFSSDLFKQHWPESYMAWMRAGSDVFTTESHKIVSIKTPTAIGDVNGDGVVNKNDVSKLNKYILAPLFVKIDKSAADIDGNGIISLVDVSKLNMLVKLVR